MECFSWISLQLFKSNVLQVLREPLENNRITISRAEGTVDFPANFMLVAALNPSKRSIDIDQWDAQEMKAVLTKLSGPLLDRMDIHIQVPRIKFEELQSRQNQDSSEKIRQRVYLARKIQADRYRKYKIYTNSQISHKLIETYCQVSKDAESLLKLAMEKFMPSIRVYDKILKIGRTIADLEVEENIRDYHISEALQYRVLDRILNFIN